MLNMKWKKDNEGRLVAVWKETREIQPKILCPCFADLPQEVTPRSRAKPPRLFTNLRARAGKRAWSLMAALLLCRGIAAQTTGTLRGTVEDGTGAVVPGARVSARSTSGSVNRAGDTDSNGNYTFMSLPVGEYDLSVTAPGFQPYRQTRLVIDLNSARVVDVTLQVGDQAQTITVTESADKAHVETSDTQLGEVIGSKKATEVPLNGRSYTDLLAIQGE